MSLTLTSIIRSFIGGLMASCLTYLITQQNVSYMQIMIVGLIVFCLFLIYFLKFNQERPYVMKTPSRPIIPHKNLNNISHKNLNVPNENIRSRNLPYEN